MYNLYIKKAYEIFYDKYNSKLGKISKRWTILNSLRKKMLEHFRSCTIVSLFSFFKG